MNLQVFFWVLAIIGAINIVLTGALLWHNLVLRKSISDFRIDYMTDISDSTGVFKKSKKLTVKGQVYLASLPIGGPVVISETTQEEFTTENVERIVAKLSGPISRLGLRIAWKKLSGL